VSGSTAAGGPTEVTSTSAEQGLAASPQCARRPRQLPLTVSAVGLQIEPRSYLDAEVTRMVDEVQAEYVRRYGGPDGAAVDPAEFTPPAGLLLVGVLDGVAVAMGGWRRLSEQTAEIKRMYVSVAARRRGFARVLLAELERTAAEAGVAELVLNTGPSQPEAVELYERAGYEPAPAFGHYACHENAIFFGKRLRAYSQEAISPG
jgi:GNAT superfamily N-acetyltransferase